MPEHGNDRYWMRKAIQVALDSHRDFRDRPFGCVITGPNGHMIGWAGGTGSALDPTRHSELVAIRQACKKLGRLLEGCTLYSTHEPCAMCAGGIVHAHLTRVVYGSARTDLPQLFRQRGYLADAIMQDCSRIVEVVPGVLRELCIALFDEEIAHLEARPQ